MRRDHNRGSIPIAAALLVLMAASLLAAAVAEIARTELVLAQHRRTFARGLVAADACLARVAASLPAAWDYGAILVGADGVAGTADDGLVPSPSGCSAQLVAGPLGATRPWLDVAASVPAGGRRLRAIVALAPSPVPAVVWVTGAATLGAVTGRLVIDGVDVARPDLRPLVGIASPDDPALVDVWLAATPGVSFAGGTGPAEYAPAPPLVDVATRLVASGARPTFAPSLAAPAPTLHVVSGDLTIAAPGFGAGILYVDGRLDIGADFAFNGVVAARDGISVASGVSTRVAGAVWVGAPAFDVRGQLVISHDRAALDAAAALAPFPRRSAVAGLVDR